MRPRRRYDLFILMVLVCGGLGVGSFLWFRGEVAAPPELDLRGIDRDVARAIEQATAAVRAAPRSGEAWGRLGMTLQAHEFDAEARQCFREAERWSPTEPRWPYFAGVTMAAMDPAAAVPSLERAVKLCGARGVNAPRLKLAEVLIELDRVDEAEVLLSETLKRDPTNARARLGLARVAFRRGDMQESLTHLSHSEQDPRAAKASKLLLAQVHARRGDAVAASQKQLEAAALGDPPAWPDPFLREIRKLRRGKKTFLIKGDLLLGQGKYAEAARLLEQTVRDYPDSPWAWILLGRARLKLRQFEAADKALHRALELEPGSVEAQFRLGVSRTLRKDYRPAIEWFRKATKNKPDFARAHFNLGYCLNELGEYSAAVEPLRAAVRSEQGNAQAHALLGHVLARVGELEEAAVHLRTGIELDPTNAWLRQRFAEVTARLASGDR